MMSLTISRIDSSRPPGVSRRKIDEVGAILLRVVEALSTQAAEAGSIVTSRSIDCTSGPDCCSCAKAAGLARKASRITPKAAIDLGMARL